MYARRPAAVVIAALASVGLVAAGGSAQASGVEKGALSAKHVGNTIQLGDVDLDRFRVRLDNGRVVPFKALTKAQKRLFQVGKLLRKGKATRKARGGVRLMSHTPTVGEERRWRALDFEFGILYGKNYRLAGIGNNIEVWVAADTNRPAPVIGTPLGQSSGTNFMDGDCRNGRRTTITPTQVATLIREFDTNIYPKESAAFSAKPFRNGVGGEAPAVPPGIAPYHPEGDGDNVVVLVDNVRDDNFYDFNNTRNFSYVAGFYSSDLDNRTNRTIMTIDAFDWLHRTGANPPHEPVPGNNCTSAPARPFLYEGVFAHEYQHLLEQYEDHDEVTWVNEGLSDWAQTLTGYVNPATPITQLGFDSHVQCFLGWLRQQTPFNPNPRETSGPENSLTVWGDQGDGEILCDYGAAYTFMEYLHGQFGTPLMTQLHRNDVNGLPGLQAVINQLGSSATTQDLIHRWAVMVAIDGLLDQGRRLRGGRASQYQTPTLNATIDWDNPHAFATPGAPPNGSDYLRLRDSAGNPVSLRNIRRIRFDGAATHVPRQIAWTVDANPPGTPGDPALYSGTGDNRDEAIVRSVPVPTGAGASLTFNAQWNLEEDARGPWDFGYVQVSTDGGATYRSLTCTDTRTDHNPDAIPPVVANLPGFSGDSNGFRPQTCSLASYAGQTVLLSFRTINDPAIQGTDPTIPPGFWVDDVAIGGTLISDGSTLAGWQSPTQVRPIPVHGFTLQLVAWTTDERGRPWSGRNAVRLAQVRLDRNFDARISEDRLEDLLGESKADFVGAIVTYDEPTESITDYAPYTLTVETRARGGDDDDDDDDRGRDRRRRKGGDD